MSGQANLKLPSGGSITIAGQDSASNFVATLPANNGTVLTTASTAAVTQAMFGAGVAGNGPAFSVYLSANQTIPSNTWTKVAFDTKVFDTNTNFSTSTNRFTPTVAGYYQINAGVYCGGSGANGYAGIYKNGSLAFYANTYPSGAGSSNPIFTCSSILQCNGTTDYIEIYAFWGGTTVGGGSTITYFNGAMVRSA
jgi:hypothetical protein